MSAINLSLRFVSFARIYRKQAVTLSEGWPVVFCLRSVYCSAATAVVSAFASTFTALSSGNETLNIRCSNCL